MLRWQIPMNFQGGGTYLMNQHTWALASTMSDANGRPIMMAGPTEAAPFLLNGMPVTIATQMPNVAPGALPIAFGNWREAYTVVTPKAVTMQSDPYSDGFCHLFKFEARIGGGITCPNAAVAVEEIWRPVPVCERVPRADRRSERSELRFLPVFLDGTSNGVQHLACLTRDAHSGKFVNLMDLSERYDIYGDRR